MICGALEIDSNTNGQAIIAPSAAMIQAYAKFGRYTRRIPIQMAAAIRINIAKRGV